MESSPPTEVEFEHRRLKPDALPEVSEAQLGPARVSIQGRLGRRAKVSRALFVISGSIVIAWGTQRAGIPLSGALCLFFGALPVLWVGGWLFGALFEARRTLREGARHAAALGSTRWQHQVEQLTVVEKVKLSLSPEGLTVTRGDAAAKRVDWGEVRVERLGPGGLAVSLASDAPLLPPRAGHAFPGMIVPRSAFSSDTAFDDFCLSMQRHVWEAERRSLTSPRA